MYRQLLLDYFDSEENFKTWFLSGKCWSSKEGLFSPCDFKADLWTFICNGHQRKLCTDKMWLTLNLKTLFDANRSNREPKVLKPLNCLYDLCVRVTHTGPTADRVDTWSKSAGRTTITNFPLVLEHLHPPVFFTSLSIFASCLSPRLPFNSPAPPFRVWKPLCYSRWHLLQCQTHLLKLNHFCRLVLH